MQTVPLQADRLPAATASGRPAMLPASPVAPLPVPARLVPDDQVRADCHALAAALLLRPPTRSLLRDLAQAGATRRWDAEPGQVGDLGEALPENPLEASWRQLAAAASIMPVDAIAAEFAALFEGTGKPLLDPYASPYLSGFMMEKPLAALRSDLAALGLARATQATVPEDHLGALCETMRLLIAGTPGYPPRPLGDQRVFFRRHLEPWAFTCLADIEQAQPASFYRCVANFVRQLLEAERRAFALDCTN